jgi:signal transduction histidine kinase
MEKEMNSAILMNNEAMLEQLKNENLALERELKIEAALERVRARTMAMHRSEELSETVYILFQQFKELGENPDQATIGVINEKEWVIEYWVTMYGHQMDKVFKFSIDEPNVTRRIYQAWKENKKSLVIDLSGQELHDFTTYRASMGGASANPAEERRFINVAFFSNGLINVQSTESRSAESLRLLERFAAVFGQSYTRFLDLKKAEEQARESQIQLALERVRAKTMAMQHSDDLKSAATLLFQQVKALGAPAYSCGYNIWEEDDKVFSSWMSTQDGTDISPALQIPLTEDANFIRFNESRKKGEEFFVLEMRGERMQEHYRYLKTMPAFKEFFEYAERAGFSQPETQIHHLANFSQGNLLFITLEPCPEFHDIFKRFAGVFDQTYTRFLDLQKAEAQARESQIQLALERVRARTMAMQKSSELKDIIQIVYDQFIFLKINIEHTGFIIDYKQNNDMHIWLADSHEVPTQVIIPYFDTPHWNSFNKAKEDGTGFFPNLLDFEEKNRFYTDLFALIPGVPEETREYYFSCPAVAISTVLLENIGLYIENFTGTPYTNDENDILMRFGKVFQQTYTRFQDLQKAEALARETGQRASVDRIRAEIASMRTTRDLERITPLIWNELTTVGVPFIRCGVFIMDEEQQQVNTFLSTPEGKGVAASFHLPFNANPETEQIVAHWNRKEMYNPHWDEAAFIDFTKVLSERGAITTGEKFLVESRPSDLYLHFIPFLQGMLYVGDTAPLSDEHLQLVHALAEAFSTAWSRYEDFNKLESAKLQIEKTLVDLKQAQSQLVQAEKMASLGELTAGIAHEIQNPLNFVNNFSEVNQELIAEMRDELEKGNLEEVAEMAKQIGDNEGKIVHHGKRADAIVKGMLQHSRTSSSTKEPTDINALADEYFRLAYHGMRAKDKSFNAAMPASYDSSIGLIPVIPQDIGRVLLNLYNNAFYAVHEKMKGSDRDYDPTVSVSTLKSDGKVEIIVKDNGNGIPQKVKDKIFQPFFTTKPTGQGTGLGLSLSYDIVKAHGGEIKVETKEGEFTEFIISLSL